MAFLRIKGIVTGYNNVADADKIITILTSEEGLIKVYANGVRRLRNKLAGCTQLFCYSEFLLYPGRDFYSLNSCEHIESFTHLSSSPELFTYGAHMLKIINDVVQEAQEAGEILKLLLNALYMLGRDKNPMLIVRAFELRLLCLSGYEPNVSYCNGCGEEAEYFSVNANGLICEQCSQLVEDRLLLLPGTISALRHLCTCASRDLFKFSISDQILSQLNKIIGPYLSKCFDKKYNTLDFIDMLN